MKLSFEKSSYFKDFGIDFAIVTHTKKEVWMNILILYVTNSSINDNQLINYSTKPK